MILFYQPALPESNFLDLEESKHCVKVLRKTNGDEISVLDGKGQLYNCLITNASHKKCEFEITSTSSFDRHDRYRHIAIAPTKNNDRIEWFVEKATEIGIDEISFIACDHSERSNLKIDRIEKKAISAMKQSLKYYLPKLNSLVSFKEFITSQKASPNYKAIAYVDFENPVQLIDQLKDQESIVCLIGPEGDFSQQEVSLAQQAGFEKVALGNSRLRTETAGIVSCHLMNL